MNFGGADYGMASYGGGGGFVPGQEFSQSGGSKKQSGEKTLLPVTIKQLLDNTRDSSSDDSFKIDGRETGQLTLIGRILSVSENSTSLTYNIDDGTGAIEVTLWTEAEPSEYERQTWTTWEQGKYIRVVGNMRNKNQNNWNIVAYHIRLIEDFNEITYHFLDVCHAHLYITRGAMAESTGKYTAPVVQSKPMAPTHTGGMGNSSSMAPTNSFSGGGAQLTVQGDGNWSPVMRAIMQAFQHCDTNVNASGWHINHVCTEVSRILGRNVNVDEVRRDIDTLASDGHIYTTIDEDHFATT